MVDPVTAYLRLTAYPGDRPEKVNPPRHIEERPLNRRFFRGPNGRTYPMNPLEEGKGNHIDLFV